jgi:hypothetical protein
MMPSLYGAIKISASTYISNYKIGGGVGDEDK